MWLFQTEAALHCHFLYFMFCLFLLLAVQIAANVYFPDSSYFDIQIDLLVLYSFLSFKDIFSNSWTEVIEKPVYALQQLYANAAHKLTNSSSTEAETKYMSCLTDTQTKRLSKQTKN